MAILLSCIATRPRRILQDRLVQASIRPVELLASGEGSCGRPRRTRHRQGAIPKLEIKANRHDAPYRRSPGFISHAATSLGSNIPSARMCVLGGTPSPMPAGRPFRDSPGKSERTMSSE